MRIIKNLSKGMAKDIANGVTKWHLVLVFATVMLQSCAYNTTIDEARNQFFGGQPNAALATLNNDNVPKRNTLLAHLDRGLIAHTAGEFKQSIDAFTQAKDHLESLDFISVKEQTGSLVINEWVTSYKGEYSERLWIHTFQMMNYLLLDEPESAAVEARQALKLYETYGDELKYDWYTRALIAMSFEAAAQYDSAHIEYKKLLNDFEQDHGVARRAWKNAKRLGRSTDASAFNRLVNSEATPNSDDGELVLFLQTGSIPQKTAGQIYIDPTLFAAFPIYPQLPRTQFSVRAQQQGKRKPADVLNVELVDISRRALAARGKSIAAKQVLRIAAKKNLAQSASGESEALGALLSVVFFATEIADTRSWETLPNNISLVQIPLEAGQQSLTVSVSDGFHTYDYQLTGVNIAPGQKTYRSIRIGAGAPLYPTQAALDTDVEPSDTLRILAVNDNNALQK